MAERPGPKDVIVWSVGHRSAEVEIFELRTLTTGLIEKFEGTWTAAIDRAKMFAVRRSADVWKQDRTSFQRVWSLERDR